MSSPRPGRRAAPKESRWAKVRVTRGGGQPNGKRVADRKPRRGAEEASASTAPFVDPVDSVAAPYEVPEVIGAVEVPLVTSPPPEDPGPRADVLDVAGLDGVGGSDFPLTDEPAPPEVVDAPLLPVPESVQQPVGPPLGRSWRVLGGAAVVLLAGCVALALAALHIGPGWLDGAGAVAVLTTYTWALMARTGGRQVVFTVLALAIGVITVAEGGDVLRSGAAVMTCVVSGVLAVVLTVPARTFVGVVREVVIATAVASVGAFATVGFEPVASTVRFEYITLALGFAFIFSLVWRFGAGLHGLGTRGRVTLLVGTVLLAGSLLYAEMLRRYGVEQVVDPTNAAVDWSRDHLGAFPNPIMTLLGVPALAWGVHMRARRRQGWWVCAFGAAATLPVAQTLVNWDTSYVEAGLQQVYGVGLGLLVGYGVIRLDLRLTGQRGRRARAVEAEHAVRPEPSRFSSL
ncbi:hypothetical protein [Nocardioides campestrisoli]|uniref:hypothetical protein n=1 Tax=Nocardioides campestrisoli TaxID=2736757 RepID=UPI0015E656C6|nr:hypothetical protein [Nocardioides campestrisoli]